MNLIHHIKIYNPFIFQCVLHCITASNHIISLNAKLWRDMEKLVMMPACAACLADDGTSLSECWAVSTSSLMNPPQISQQASYAFPISRILFFIAFVLKT